jgi:hypothetical protein
MTIVAIRDRHTVALAKWKLLTSPYPGGILKRELAPPSRSTLGCNNPPGFTNMAATPASEIPCKEKDRLMRLYIVAASDYRVVLADRAILKLKFESPLILASFDSRSNRRV